MALATSNKHQGRPCKFTKLRSYELKIIQNTLKHVTKINITRIPSFILTGYSINFEGRPRKFTKIWIYALRIILIHLKQVTKSISFHKKYFHILFHYKSLLQTVHIKQFFKIIIIIKVKRTEGPDSSNSAEKQFSHLQLLDLTEFVHGKRQGMVEMLHLM